MRLNYGDVLSSETRIVSVGRDIANLHAAMDGALDRVFYGEGAKATEVVKELELLLSSTRAGVVADRGKIEEFLPYARHHVELEKAKTLLRKAALAMKKAGVRYDKAQMLFSQALEDVGADEIDETRNPTGWYRDGSRRGA